MGHGAAPSFLSARSYVGCCLTLRENTGRCILESCATVVHGEGGTQWALHSVWKSAVACVNTTSQRRANEIDLGFVVVNRLDILYGDTRHSRSVCRLYTENSHTD